MIDCYEVLVHRIQKVEPQKFELLVEIVQVGEKVDEFLVEEIEVVVFLVLERGEFLVVVLLWWFQGLDFLAWEQKYVGQRYLCLIKLLQDLVGLLKYLDFEVWSEIF